MIRAIAIVFAVAAFATAASAQPLALKNEQMDQVSAGALSLSVLTLATTHVGAGVSLPAPLSSPLAVSQAANVSISIDATVHPATIDITHPGH